MINLPFSSTVTGISFLMDISDRLTNVTPEQIAAAEPEDRGSRSDVIIGSLNDDEKKMFALSSMSVIKNLPVPNEDMFIETTFSHALHSLVVASFFNRNPGIRVEYGGAEILAGWQVKGIPIEKVFSYCFSKDDISVIKKALSEKLED